MYAFQIRFEPRGSYRWRDVTTITRKFCVLEAAILLLLMSAGQPGFFLHELLSARSQMARESILPLHVHNLLQTDSTDKIRNV